jgi:hypothetical protein
MISTFMSPINIPIKDTSERHMLSLEISQSLDTYSRIFEHCPKNALDFKVSWIIELNLLDSVSVCIDSVFDLVFQFHHLEVILQLLQLLYILCVFYVLSLLTQGQFLDPSFQCLAKDLSSVHQILFLTKNVQICSLKSDPMTQGLNRSDFYLLPHLALSDVALHPLQKMNINVVLCSRQLFSSKHFVSRWEEIDFGTVNIREKRFEELK